VAGELCLNAFSIVKGQQKIMGLVRARGEKVVLRFQDGAGIKVSSASAA